MATKVQMPGGTRRHGVGNRPFASYSIVRVDEKGAETQIGLTHRVEDEGKTRWRAESGTEQSGLFDVHREAVEWLCGSRPSPEAPKGGKATPEQLEAAVAAKKERTRDLKGQTPATPELGESPESQPEPVPADHDTRDKDGVEHEDESHLDIDQAGPKPLAEALKESVEQAKQQAPKAPRGGGAASARRHTGKAA